MWLSGSVAQSLESELCVQILIRYLWSNGHDFFADLAVARFQSQNVAVGLGCPPAGIWCVLRRHHGYRMRFLVPFLIPPDLAVFLMKCFRFWTDLAPAVIKVVQTWLDSTLFTPANARFEPQIMTLAKSLVRKRDRQFTVKMQWYFFFRIGNLWSC